MLLGFTCTSAQAVTIMTSGDPAAGTATLTITQPIQFTIWNSPAVNNIPNHLSISFIIDEAAAPHDGSRTDASATGLSFTINDGAPLPVHTWRDNLTAEAENVTRNDAQLYNTADAPFNFSPGDVVTLLPGTLSITTPVNHFNMFPTGDYTIWIAGQNGYRLSGDGVVATPEPSTLLLGCAGLGGMLLCRRRH